MFQAISNQFYTTLREFNQTKSDLICLEIQFKRPLLILNHTHIPKSVLSKLMNVKSQYFMHVFSSGPFLDCCAFRHIFHRKVKYPSYELISSALFQSREVFFFVWKLTFWRKDDFLESSWLENGKSPHFDIL